jgi:hypothetical protein
MIVIVFFFGLILLAVSIESSLHRHRHGHRYWFGGRGPSHNSGLHAPVGEAAAFSLKGTAIALFPLVILGAVVVFLQLARLSERDHKAQPPISGHVHHY